MQGCVRQKTWAMNQIPYPPAVTNLAPMKQTEFTAPSCAFTTPSLIAPTKSQKVSVPSVQPDNNNLPEV